MEAVIEKFEKELIAENYDTPQKYISKVIELMVWLKENDVTSWKQVKAKHIISFFEKLKTKRKKNGELLRAATLNSYRDVYKKFSSFLQANKYGYFRITVSKFIEENKYQPTVLSVEQVKILFATVDQMDVWLLSDRDRVMLHLLYTCGLRIGEVVNINIEDIYFDAAYIHLKYEDKRRTKNARERKVILLPEVIEAIELYIQFSRLTLLGANADERGLMISEKGKRLGKQSLEDRLKAIIQFTGNDELMNLKITPHHLRHSLASHLLNNGLDVEDVQFILGHESTDSTDRYLHLILNKKKYD